MTEMPLRKRILIIHNPTSGRGDRLRVAAVENRLQKSGATPMTMATERPGHAIDIAMKATREDWDAVVAAGGDGTVNEVINGLARSESPPPLGLIPLGTANVLSLEIGLDRSAETQAKTIAFGDTLDFQPGILDAGTEKERLFSLMAGAGFDARVVASIRPKEKKLWGKGAYILQAIRALSTPHTSPVEIRVDGQDYHAGSVIIMNARHYAGPYKAAPEHELSKPGFHVLLLKGGRWNTVRQALALAQNRLHKQANVILADSVSLSGPHGAPIQLDGDNASKLPATVSVSSVSIRLIVPQHPK